MEFAASPVRHGAGGLCAFRQIREQLEVGKARDAQERVEQERDEQEEE